ncbi:hypothetical protein OB905_05830 [Halobacteria archaeon AArc-dxtr1]|nr:hypothetical protein [Halobacteria archaeon AArc-dxtr1]
MINRLFEFEEEQVPPAVVVAVGILLSIFALGAMYRVVGLLV